MKKKNKDEFIASSNNVHNSKYDYSKVNYVNNKTKVCIICPKHGEFWQTPHAHLRGQGCPMCGSISRLISNTSTNCDFIEKAKDIHGNKYDYSKVEYKNAHTKVCIICPEHGEFWQTPHNHLKGYGCPKCGLKKNIESRTSNVNEFITKSNIVHSCKYDYSESEYVNNHTRIKIKCNKHGFFYQLPYDHLNGKGCPKCGNIMSKAEDEISSTITSLNIEKNNKIVLNGKEIDIYVPSLKLGIEYNGLRWHSEEFGKDRNYHIDKLNECNKKGIKLIQIFEDEWVNHREICKSKLKQICGLNNNPKIYARKCEIREIKNKNLVYEFLDKKHIQGRTGFTIALGAYYQDKLVGIMTFKKEKEGYWDLNRFATDINYQCIGFGGKLFKYFARNYEYQEVKSFADRRWTTNPTDNLYTKLGFEFNSYIEPTYWYYNQNVDRYKRFHKFGFRKQILNKRYGLPLSMTEREMTDSLGYVRIWDCGLIKYVFKK